MNINSWKWVFAIVSGGIVSLGILVLLFRATVPPITQPDANLPIPARLVEWSPKEDMLAVANYGTVTVWPVRFDGKNPEAPLFASNSTFDVTSLEWHPSEQFIAIGYDSGLVQIWDVNRQQEVSSYRKHSRWIRMMSWRSDGKQLATSDGNTRIYDLITQTEILDLQDISWVRWAEDDQLLVGQANNGKVRVWNANTLELLSEFDSYFTTISPDRTRVAGVQGTFITVWDMRTGQVISRAETTHGAGIISVEWSPDGNRVASGSGTLGDDYSVRVWDAETGKQLHILESHTNSAFDLKWQSNGDYLVSAGFDSTILVWNVTSGELVKTVQLEQIGNGEQIAFSPTGSYVAMLTFDRASVQLFRLLDP